MSVTNAWLIDFGDGCHAAIGQRELFHLVYQPKIFPVAQCPAYCDRVIVWEEHLLPVWSVVRWLRGTAGTAESRLMAIVGYQTGHAAESCFGALEIAVPPQRIVANDADACALPVKEGRWEEIATACFVHQSKPIPVLSLPAMFGQPLSAGG